MDNTRRNFLRDLLQGTTQEERDRAAGIPVSEGQPDSRLSFLKDLIQGTTAEERGEVPSTPAMPSVPAMPVAAQAKDPAMFNPGEPAPVPTRAEIEALSPAQDEMMVESSIPLAPEPTANVPLPSQDLELNTTQDSLVAGSDTAPRIDESAPARTRLQDLENMLGGSRGLEDAQASRRRALQNAMAHRLADRSLQSSVAAQGGEYTPDEKLQQARESLAGLDITEFGEQTKDIKDKIDIQKSQDAASSEAQLNDPTSGVSKKYRDIAKRIIKSELPPSITAAQISKMIPGIQQLSLEQSASSKKKEEKIPEGQKVLDREFAKDFNKWTSGGQKTANIEIDKLTKVANDLKSRKVTTGRATGLLPDSFTDRELLKARSDIQSSIMASLREILGAQFTEKEGERVIKNTWNEQDSTKNNLDRVNRLINTLKSQAEDKTKKAEFFEKNNTLKDYRAEGPVQSETVRIKDPNGIIRLIPRSKASAALQAGGTLAE